MRRYKWILILWLVRTKCFKQSKHSAELFQDASEEKRCIEKVVLQKETEYDREVQCHHRSEKLKMSPSPLIMPK